MFGFRFRLPDDWKLSQYQLNSIFVVGLDGMPWPCKVKMESPPVGAAADDAKPILEVVRNQNESGRVYFIYPFTQHGQILICTGTLPLSNVAYDLLKELARGTLNRLRNQLSIWSEGGLVIADSIYSLVADATQRLSDAITVGDSGEQDRLAAESLELSMSAIFELSTAFGDQIARYRREHSEFGSFWSAVRLIETGKSHDHVSNLLKWKEFDAVESDFDADLVKRISKSKKQYILGPLLDASPGGMSNELLELEDFNARKSHLLTAGRKKLESLPKTSSLIHVISGLNGIGHRHLSYPQQLQIATDLLQMVDDAMLEVPTMISFDFPWAERLASAVGGMHPLQIADSLMRYGVGISYLGLEINLDYWPSGSVIRDPLQWVDLIDIWAQMELPLILCLRCPSGDTSEAMAESKDRTINRKLSSTTEQQRHELLDTVLPMMVARPAVQGIIWQQSHDAADIRFPAAGLLDTTGSIKPIRQVLEKLQKLISG